MRQAYGDVAQSRSRSLVAASPRLATAAATLNVLFAEVSG